MKKILYIFILLAAIGCTKDQPEQRDLEAEVPRPITIHSMVFGYNGTSVCYGTSIVQDNQTIYISDPMCWYQLYVQPELHLPDNEFTVYLYNVSNGFTTPVDTFEVDLDNYSDTLTIDGMPHDLFIAWD
jgi:hypothetical protein